MNRSSVKPDEGMKVRSRLTADGRFMRLERLEINGFKSFSDRSELAFDKGVTAIVGPNGCGKSNVADAIRWVLGEQSAKALRGGEMADVIFNGTDGRKPLGMVEVSLTIGVGARDIVMRLHFLHDS